MYYEEIALETENVNICYKIKDNDLRLHCVGILSLNSPSCKLIKEQEIRSYCYEEIAERTENI